MSEFLVLFAEVVAQSIDESEKIDEVVDTASLTGWDIAAALIVLALTWPVASWTNLPGWYLIRT